MKAIYYLLASQIKEKQPVLLKKWCHCTMQSCGKIGEHSICESIKKEFRG